MKKILSTLTIVLISAAAFASGVVATAIGTNPGCNGMCNGSATAMASGGAGPYGFTWTGPSGYTAAGANISGLCAGTYIVTATDSSDMSIALYTVLLTEPSAINPGATSNSPVCENSSITFAASPAGASYSWAGPGGYTSTAQNPVISTVTAASTGTYTLTVTVGGCSATTTTMVTVNPSPHISITPFPATCGICNGYIGNGTTAASTYSWVGPSGPIGTMPSLSGLCPGSYTLTASNTFGCSTAGSTTVVNSPPVFVTTGPVTPATCGSCNGGTTIVATGGTPPYQYSVSPMGATPAVVTGLCEGTYTVNVTDGNGCVAVNVFTVVSSPSITALSSTSTPASCGGSNGSFTLGSATGGVSPYAYSVDSGTFSATTSYTGLAAGSYTVEVKDANGCTYSTSVIVGNSGGPTAAAITTVNTGCSTSIGEINIGAVTGGVAPYTYSVNGSAYSSAVSYTGLPAGVYAVMIKDFSGCIFTQPVTISSTGAPVIVLDSIHTISCAGISNGSISISVTGGTPGYTYLWSPGGTTTQDLLNITAAGMYSVSVTDAGGCTAMQYYVVNYISPIYPNLTSISGNCGSPGSVSVAPTGGTAPYTYLWNTTPAQTGATIAGVPSGYYNCVITDSTGCSNIAYGSVYNACYNVIQGNVYNDVNGNCIAETGDTPLIYHMVTASGASGVFYGSTDAAGNYTILTQNTNNVVAVSTYGYPYMTNSCSAGGSLNVNFTTPGDTLRHNDFGLYADPAYFDLGIHPGWTIANPGFSKTYWIFYTNASPVPHNAVMTFVYDSVLQYVSCTDGGVHYPAQHKIEWTFTGIPVSPSLTTLQRPYIYFNVSSTLSTSTLLHNYFEITPITGDAYTFNNTLTSDESVLGCHDPNSILVNPLGIGPNGDILQTDSILTYTVHFQNNGNDTAHFVEVKDTLSHFLDPATVVPGASSHPYTFNLSGEGVLAFRFDNIMLPDSTSAEAASNGYFTYTVNVKHGTPVGSVINNTANIYFDYNPAVITNTAINTIVDVSTGIAATSSNNDVKVFPNPFTDNTTFVIRPDKANDTYSFEMTDVLGKTVRLVKGISEKQFTVSRSGLQNGIYFYKIYNTKNVVGMGKLIIE